MQRKPLPKALRFEVFKRDKFTCQYCGRTAPDIILEVDHINPVSKGGKDEIMNLITACRDCNRGKTDRTLDDGTIVKKQQRQLIELQERREQIEMMLQWREALSEEIETEIDAIESIFERETGCVLYDKGRKDMKKLIRQFGFNEVYTATEISIERYWNGYEKSIDNVFNKIGGICYNRKKAREQNA